MSYFLVCDCTAKINSWLYPARGLTQGFSLPQLFGKTDHGSSKPDGMLLEQDYPGLSSLEFPGELFFAGLLPI